MQERRLTHRYALPLPAMLKRVEKEMGLLQAKTRDISTHGIYLMTDQPLTVGLNFILSVTLPKIVTHGCEVVLDARATVIRVDRPQAHGNVESFGIAALIGIHNINPFALGFALHRAELSAVLGK